MAVSWPDRLRDKTVEIIAPIASFGAGSTGLANATETWQFAVYGACSALGIGFSGYNAISLTKFDEPVAVRRRCHDVLRLISETLFPEGENSIQTTLLMPIQTRKRGLVVRPQVRHVPGMKYSDPSSKSSFRVNENKNMLIYDAWMTPYKVAQAVIPSETFSDDDEARGFFQKNLGNPEEEVKKVSKRTRRELTWIANVSFRPDGGDPTGMISFAGTGEIYDLTEDKYQEPLSDMLKGLAYWLS